MQLYARYGLAELRRPGGPRFDPSWVFESAYLTAMQLLGGDQGFYEDLDEEEFRLSLFVALVVELEAEGLSNEATQQKAAQYITSYFCREYPQVSA